MDGASIGMKSMSAVRLELAFFDTNILVYADDGNDPVKQQKARELIRLYFSAERGVISVQVLQEYFNTVTSKTGLDHAVARAKVNQLRRFVTVDTDSEDVLSAIDLCRLHGLSFWDSLIVHSAKQSACKVLFSEDLQHGRDIDELRIVDPFR